MTLAVLLTCHNRKEKTLTCLSTLYTCKMPENLKMDVFLVDDGSTDGTSNAISEAYPNVVIIPGTGNLFWNRGMYLAWSKAEAKKNYNYFLWLNDDTYLFANALEELTAAADLNNNRTIIIGSACSKTNGKITYSGYDSDGLLIIPEQPMKEATTFNGNCVLIPDFVFEKVGKLDPLFHHAIGDIDYGHRALAKGIKSYVAPKVLGFCEGHDLLPTWCLKEIPFRKRIKSLYSPLGNSHPYYFFRYEFRHYGFATAIKHLITIHLRVSFPGLWK